MIKTIEVKNLCVGMYLHALPAGWADHPFLRNRFVISSESDIRKIADCGFITVQIDTSRGIDAPAPVAALIEEAVSEERSVAIQNDNIANDVVKTTDFSTELRRAKGLISQAVRVVQELVQDVRLGKILELDRVRETVHEIVDSITRNPNALLVLLQLKTKDDYTFLHSVSLCALMAAFCRSSGLSEEMTCEAALGGLLHDIGKAMVPDAILNKPGKLTPDEFEVIKTHPKQGHAKLSQVKGLSVIALEITLRHHERIDGTGYPDGLKGAQISHFAQMAAIVDVYDAITSDRCYHKGITPASALRKLLDWSTTQYKQELVRAFIQCIGIYPSGSLVLLQSGRLGVVTEQNDKNLLCPVVNVFFSAKSNTYISPERINLATAGGVRRDDIVSIETPEKWRVEPRRFMEIA